MTRRVARALPVGEVPVNWSLTMQQGRDAGLVRAVDAPGPPAMVFSPVFAWLVGSEIADGIGVSLGSGTYASAITTAGELPETISYELAAGVITFSGTPTEAASGSVTITVTDSAGATAAVLVTWSVVAASTPEFADLPDGSVVASAGSLSYSGGVYTSSGPYGTELTDPATAPSAGEYFTITLPAGTYTGNVRLTVISNTLSSVYDHHLFLESSTPEFSGNPVAVDVYDYDIGPLLAGDVIFCPAGVDNGSGADSGTVTFSLQFEAS